MLPVLSRAPGIHINTVDMAVLYHEMQNPWMTIDGYLDGYTKARRDPDQKEGIGIIRGNPYEI